MIHQVVIDIPLKTDRTKTMPNYDMAYADAKRQCEEQLQWLGMRTFITQASAESVVVDWSGQWATLRFTFRIPITPV